METTLAVIPTNWTILSVSFSAGPMIHWMNSPERKSEKKSVYFDFFLYWLCREIVMIVIVIVTIK